MFFSYLDNFNIYSFLTSSFFVNSFFFSDSIVKLSFIDLLFLIETSKINYNRELYDLFFWDALLSFNLLFVNNNIFFYTNFQDITVIISYYSPELILVFLDYAKNFVEKTSFSNYSYIIYDLFSDKLFVTTSQLVSYFFMAFLYIWIIIVLFNIFRSFNFFNYSFFYINMIYYNTFFVSKENRFQLDAFLLVFFFFIFYWTMMILTFDSDKEEMIESFNSLIFGLFCFLITFLFIKYSTHYFSFLEASIEEGRSVLFILKQFFRDFINTFSLFLRFFVLLFRLNVYDTLDDFYDSYYIFLCDFDDDEYMSELFFSGYSIWFYDNDNEDDSSYSSEDESDSVLDLFYMYFISWAKLYLFIFFIAEEFLRLILAFFISYLIIFDIHAVNSSYVEDTFFSRKRLSFNNKLVNNL